MDAAAIIDDLTHCEEMPKAALKVASVRRAEMVPVFLRKIDSYLAGDPAERARPTPLFFIFHLFGEWREKAAYRPLARLLRAPAAELDAILGDAITTTTHRVMAAVFDGDPQPLYEIICDPKAEEFVRSRMCETLAMSVLAGDLDPKGVARFLRDAFMELQPQARCYVWQGWQSAIAMLGLAELKSLVKRAFDRGFIDRYWLGYKDFEEDLEWGIKRPGEPRRPGDDEFTLFGDTIEELEGWFGFSEEYLANRPAEPVMVDPELEADEPYRNPQRLVGRDDPCPCGSGKKFKKCCINR